MKKHNKDTKMVTMIELAALDLVADGDIFPIEKRPNGDIVYCHKDHMDEVNKAKHKKFLEQYTN